MHFTPKSKETAYLIVITQLGSKCNDGIMGFGGKLPKHLLHRGQGETKL